MEERIIRSIDTFTIEVYEDSNGEHVEISPCSLRGRGAGIEFKKGDPLAGCAFLSKVSKLIGLDEVVSETVDEKTKQIAEENK